MATDVSLLTTRVVAERTLAVLGLTLSPQEILDSVTPVPTGSTEVLQITMTAPTEAEAIRRLEAFTTTYLRFRAEEVSARSQILITGYERRLEEHEAQLQDVDKKIAVTVPDDDTMTDLVTERSKLRQQISSLEDLRQEAELQQSAVVNASRAIDSVAPAPPPGLRRVVLVLTSAIIGGAALGVFLVLVQAIVSDRLWLRMEVATALAAPVILSLRSVAPLPRVASVLAFLPPVRQADARRGVDRQRLGHALSMPPPQPSPRHCLAVICLPGARDVQFGLVAAALSLQDAGQTVTLVDLTSTGGVAGVVARLVDPSIAERPEVFRPKVVPSLRNGPADLAAADWDDLARANVRNGTTLLITDLDPAVGVDYLTAWTNDVLVAVTAGKSSAELVRTAGELIRSAGLHLRGAVLLKTVRDDVSSAQPAGTGTRQAKTATTQNWPDVGSGQSRLP
jgi:hypothetical protein